MALGEEQNQAFETVLGPENISDDPAIPCSYSWRSGLYAGVDKFTLRFGLPCCSRPHWMSRLWSKVLKRIIDETEGNGAPKLPEDPMVVGGCLWRWIRSTGSIREVFRASLQPNAESSRALTQEFLVQANETTIRDHHYGVPGHVFGDHTHDLYGPHCSNYHLRLRPIKKAIDPNDASDSTLHNHRYAGKTTIP